MHVDFIVELPTTHAERRGRTGAGAASERLADAALASLKDDDGASPSVVDYARAVAGLRQALVLWRGNAEARIKLEEVRLAYAERALDTGDRRVWRNTVENAGLYGVGKRLQDLIHHAVLDKPLVGDDQGAVDPARIVQQRVQGLVENDPERVGKILSRWAREEKVGA